MKQSNILTIIMVMPTGVVCQSSGIQARDEAGPLVKLYFGEILPLGLPLNCYLADGQRGRGHRGVQSSLCF